ncbi:hypothetical protein RE476_11050 [Methanolobus mangrovi]|uniref:Uncharacterized protein n=1 Tax=Methanolobus mangrovi TaxID=3072977 RepID=A0AA51UEX7_9EURY|nr:hypothetical protein [Methanolobus mangrovi]WMW21898.1 hypothetical protein RE476_11050 [Methanolobus mangrovi]
MKKHLILVLCLLGLVLFAGGCIDELVPIDEEDAQQVISAYEFEVFLNDSYAEEVLIPTHSFYLSKNGSAKVVSIIENESVIDIIPLEDLSTSDNEVVSNIVVLGDISNKTNATPEQFTDFSLMENGSDINYTITEDVIRGQKHVFITFEEPMTGFVAYTMATPLGQDFIYITTPPSVVRFVLPEGYTTGNSLIGKPKPSPDEFYVDTVGRENLVWRNEVKTTGFLGMLGRSSQEDTADVEPVPKLISVKFYTTSAPKGLTVAATILGLIALFVISRYQLQKKKLEMIRSNIEKQVVVPKKKGKD